MKQKEKYLSGLTIMILLSTGLQTSLGQISSSTADAVKDLTYLTYTGNDPLFVFYQKNESYYPAKLTAGLPLAGNFDFIWTKYDPDTDGFNIPVFTESGVISSTINEIDEGGYRVQISNGINIDTSFIAWVMLDNFKVWTVKDALGQVPDGESGCPGDLNWIRIAGGVELDKGFYYFDLQSHDTLRFTNNYDMEWTSDNRDLLIPNRTNKNALGGNYSINPPYEDTWYILTATDSLGMTERDSVFFDSKFTKAEFTVEYYDKVTNQWDADLSISWDAEKGSLDAPLQVRFNNSSLNGYEYTWVFLDTSNEETGEPFIEFFNTDNSDYSPEFTYYTADRFYYPYLVSISDESCRDTFYLEDGVNVVAAKLLIPNVFSPNGDGTNDYFIFQHQSIKQFKITISDRTGRIVYKDKIEDIYEWEGWRGTILNTDRPAPEGQYYYVIEGLGYDNKEFRDLSYIQQKLLERKNGSANSTPSTPTTGSEPTTQNLYAGWVYLYRNFSNN